MTELNQVELTDYQRRLVAELKSQIAPLEAAAAAANKMLATALGVAVAVAGGTPGGSWALNPEGTRLTRLAAPQVPAPPGTPGNPPVA